MKLKKLQKFYKKKVKSIWQIYTSPILSQMLTLNKIITMHLNSTAQFLLFNPCMTKLCSGLCFGTDLNWAKQPKSKRMR